MNFFDVEKEYFIIDSNNLSTTKSHLYGYMVQENGVFDNSNVANIKHEQFTGCGAYIFVKVVSKETAEGGGIIQIYQDFNGCFGLYLYRDSDYFALSNSFLRLLDHIKSFRPLSVNQNFINYFLTTGLCSESPNETAIEQISIVDKDAVVTIDIEEKKLSFDFHYTKEKSIQPSSAEGIKLLDAWYIRWTSFFRGLASTTDQIQANLSGGFDSRLTFLLLLKEVLLK